MQTFDLEARGLRELNASLHALKGQTNMSAWEVINPKGAHAIAAGLDAPVEVIVKGSTGYYCAGMNKQATCTSCRLGRAGRGGEHDVGQRHRRR
jgi:glutamate synthase domain-containing protein 3